LDSMTKSPSIKVTQVARELLLARENGNPQKVVEDFLPTDEAKQSPYVVAVFWAYAGEKEKAFEWLEKAYSARQADLISLKIDPDVDSLRDDPRFADLLRRLNLAN